jgi:hypothetical protein
MKKVDLIDPSSDFILAAAYRGEIDGIDPSELMLARAEHASRRLFRDVKDILAHISQARVVVTEAPRICLCGGHDSEPKSCPLAVADVRMVWFESYYDFVHEAALIQGCAIIMHDMDLIGERQVIRKFMLRGASPEQIRAFIKIWGPAQGLTGLYKDPVLGVAGGFLAM